MNDSQVVELVQPEVAEPGLPLELMHTLEKLSKTAESIKPKVEDTDLDQSKVAEPLQPIELTQRATPKKINKHVEPVRLKGLEPVHHKVVDHLRSFELMHTLDKLSKTYESIQPKVEDADLNQSKVTEPLQSKVAEPLQSKVAESLQPIELTQRATPKKISKHIEPVHHKVVEPVQPKVVEPVKPKISEPVKLDFVQPVKPKIVEPVQSENAAPVHSEDAEPVESSATEPDQSKVAEPFQSEVTGPVQDKDAEPVQSNIGEAVQSDIGEPVQPEVGAPVPPRIAKPKPKAVTKLSIRKTMWDQLYRSKLVLYPLPFGRIPNFIGAEQASAKLLELDVFQKAKSVQVNPDKSLESARMLVLNNEKDLYVPCPGLNRSLMLKLERDDEHDIKSIVTRWGIDNLGKRIHMKDEVSIDLMVTGSVAVSENGYRIGKGQGYTDMEYAILKDMKAIDNNTVIVTIVHDSQVMDLPEGIFEKYDVPVDYILTPTRIIKVNHNLPKPEGIFWTEFTQRQLKARKFFKELKLMHESEGRDTTLKVETPADRYMKIPHRKWPLSYKRRKPKPRPVDDETATRNRKPAVRPTKKVIPPRSTPVKNAISTSIGTEEPSEDIENIPPPKKTKKKKKKPQIVYSLKVSNIEKTVRLRDLKMALIERGIKPNKIAWKGSRGYCYLNYAKKKPKKEGEEEGDGADRADGADEESDAINSVIELIQALKIHSENCFVVKVMEPITRIETVEVTAV